MATETIPMDDKEMFAAAMAPEPKAETPQAPEQQPPERPRDEQGRFAPKEQTMEAKPETPAEQPPPATEQSPPTTETDQGGQVPSWRLREVSEARQAAERRAQETERQAYALQAELRAMQQQMQQFQQPREEPIDIFTDPERALAQRLNPLVGGFQQEITALRLEVSRERAERRHGVEPVAKMEQALEQAVNRGDQDALSLIPQMRASRDPVGLAMSWHNGRRVQEVGDLDAWFEKKLEEKSKDPAFQAKVLAAARGQATANAGSGPSPINLPPSLNSIPGSGASMASDAGGMSDRELFANATKGMRR